MEMNKEVFIIPEPKYLRFTGRWFAFSGFSNLSSFLKTEFNIPEGDWIISIAEEGLCEESKIRIEDKRVTIYGNKNVGYATLIQLAIQGKGYLPEVEIRETFRFKFRGYHLDIARGGVPRVETFKKILRLLFLLKYNYFAIYFEDLFPWESYPQIGARRGRLSREELMEIINYGGKLGIEVFPSLELSGHMENILSLPEFQKFSEWHNPREGCLDLSNDEAREFAYRLLEEAMDQFTLAKYIHIGGDETWALGRGRSLNRTWIFEGSRLYEKHHKEMIDRVLRRGKEPILWGDMISGMYLREGAEKWVEILKSDIWRSSLIANWDYSPRSKDYFRSKIRIFKDKGLRQIVCPGLSNWNRYYPNFELALENLRNFLSAAAEENIDGFLVTAWGDDGEECLFSLLDPLIFAAMEIAEGQGNWEKKWLTISGEDDQTLKSRLLFGRREFSDIIKHVIFKDDWYRRLSEEERRRIYTEWERMLKEVKNFKLPGDLDFIRRLLVLGIKILKGEAKASDYIALSSVYSSLWLEERKPEGLERIIERFWGMAGKIDAGLS